MDLQRVGLTLLCWGDRVEWMALGRAALERALPLAAHEPLGLPLIGDTVGRDWTDAEAQQFEEGMLLFGRDFPAIRKQFLPQRQTEHLVLYYYNVWKTQSTARAQSWYHRLAEVSPCHQSCWLNLYQIQMHALVLNRHQVLGGCWLYLALLACVLKVFHGCMSSTAWRAHVSLVLACLAKWCLG